LVLQSPSGSPVTTILPDSLMPKIVQCLSCVLCQWNRSRYFALWCRSFIASNTEPARLRAHGSSILAFLQTSVIAAASSSSVEKKLIAPSHSSLCCCGCGRPPPPPAVAASGSRHRALIVLLLLLLLILLDTCAPLLGAHWRCKVVVALLHQILRCASLERRRGTRVDETR